MPFVGDPANDLPVKCDSAFDSFDLSKQTVIKALTPPEPEASRIERYSRY